MSVPIKIFKLTEHTPLIKPWGKNVFIVRIYQGKRGSLRMDSRYGRYWVNTFILYIIGDFGKKGRIRNR